MAGQAWRRKGYKSEADYRAACQRARSIKAKALAGSNARYAARAVLMAACHGPWADFDSCHVIFTKAQMQQYVGVLDTKTMKAALRVLRLEGSLVPVKNWQGGRHVPTTYSVQAVGQGGQATADEAGQGAQEQETATDPVITRMREIQAQRSGINAMRAYEVAQAEIEGPKE
jgi:hypothetical protein